jgi:hypothetical protein
VPWTAWLALSLPGDHLDRRWNIAWVGFDVALACGLGVTAWLGWKGSPRLGLPAAVSATLLAVDAWFDCLTARRGGEYVTAIATALFVELPLCAVLAWLAYRSIGASADRV